MQLPLLGLLGTVLAGDPGQVPDLNVQLFRPDGGSERTLWADDTQVAASGTPYLGLAFTFARNPFVYEYDDGRRVDVLSDLLEADALMGVSLGPARVGMDLPVYLLAAGEGVSGPAGLGDISLDGRATLIQRTSAPLGLGVGGRVVFPTSTISGPLANPVTAWEASLIADREFGDVRIAANLGTRGVPQVQLENIVLDDQFFFRLGAGWAAMDGAGVSLDLAGGVPWTTPVSTAGSTPVEGLLGGWLRLGDALLLRAGVGTGFTRGIGTPRMRDVIMLSWEPTILRDFDEDGLADRDDACRTEPEDRDGFEDEDGCPDPCVRVLLRVEDPDGQLVGAANLHLDGTALATQGTGLFQTDVHPGQYVVNVRAEGYLPLDAPLVVPDQPDTQATYRLVPATGLVRLVVAAPGGQPVDGAWTVDEHEAPATTSGRAEIRLEPGAHALCVTVPGFHPVERQVTVAAGEVVEVPVTVQRAVVSEARIEIADSVYFELGKSVIKPESYGLLDEVAQILHDHPEILRLRIEGHTDSRGSAQSNLKLSDRRARAVRTYLVSKGVQVSRLEAIGHGESRPLDPRETGEAWARNRRVDFFIVERKPAP
ncbi:MAG: OmpA family protein [Deltaproteobacteria bacterium]|nr:OmpA family protein [Deltaproteobacteria bacterium]